MPLLQPKPASEHRVVDVERSVDGIIIAFEDGRTAVFQTDWLYQHIPQAAVVLEPDDPASLNG